MADVCITYTAAIFESVSYAGGEHRIVSYAVCVLCGYVNTKIGMPELPPPSSKFGN